MQISSAFGFGITKTKCYTDFAKVLPTFLLMSSQVPNSISLSDSAKSVSLTRNQIRGFWASWGGWALDGMDSFIYALVLVPSLRELLPRSGIPATKGNIGVYGGLLFALFLVGWGLAFLWGPIGDKFGRVRTLMLTIAWYSLFTFLSALVTSVWQLAVLRLLAGGDQREPGTAAIQHGAELLAICGQQRVTSVSSTVNHRSSLEPPRIRGTVRGKLQNKG